MLHVAMCCLCSLWLGLWIRLILLLEKTFHTRKNTVYRVTSSLMSELPLTLAEARTKAEHARYLLRIWVGS